MWKRVVAIVALLSAVIAFALTRIDGAGTLNSIAWMDFGTVIATDGQIIRFDGDREAIDWLNDNVSGSPVIAEAVVVKPDYWGGAYTCGGSRIAVATGLPTVMGWDRHESQQRPTTGFRKRERDIHTLYTSTGISEKRQVIETYRIEYIISGPLEAIYPEITPDNTCKPTGSPGGISALASMVGSDLEVVFSRDGTTIYHVLSNQ
ncbi:MAG: hypothetical protein ACRDHN_11310 [Thermomicrobiales bacterium]